MQMTKAHKIVVRACETCETCEQSSSVFMAEISSSSTCCSDRGHMLQELCVFVQTIARITSCSDCSTRSTDKLLAKAAKACESLGLLSCWWMWISLLDQTRYFLYYCTSVLQVYYKIQTFANIYKPHQNTSKHLATHRLPVSSVARCPRWHALSLSPCFLMNLSLSSFGSYYANLYDLRTTSRTTCQELHVFCSWEHRHLAASCLWRALPWHAFTSE